MCSESGRCQLDIVQLGKPSHVSSVDSTDSVLLYILESDQDLKSIQDVYNSFLPAIRSKYPEGIPEHVTAAFCNASGITRVGTRYSLDPPPRRNMTQQRRRVSNFPPAAQPAKSPYYSWVCDTISNDPYIRHVIQARGDLHVAVFLKFLEWQMVQTDDNQQIKLPEKLQAYLAKISELIHLSQSNNCIEEDQDQNDSSSDINDDAMLDVSDMSDNQMKSPNVQESISIAAEVMLKQMAKRLVRPRWMIKLDHKSDIAKLDKLLANIAEKLPFEMH